MIPAVRLTKTNAYLVLLALTACAGADGSAYDALSDSSLDGSAEYGDAQMPLLDAEDAAGSLGAAPHMRAVVWLNLEPGSSAATECTATKIGATRFLTAAHCLVRVELREGDSIGLTNRLDGNFGAANSPLVTTLALHLFPGWTASDPREQPTVPDIAIIDVEELTPGIPSWDQFSFARVGPTTGALDFPYRVVGFGCGGLYGRKRTGLVQSWSRSASPDDREWDDNHSSNIVSYNKVNACNVGDDGGPLFDEATNRIVGVTRYATRLPDRGFVTLYSRLDGIGDFI